VLENNQAVALVLLKYRLAAIPGKVLVTYACQFVAQQPAKQAPHLRVGALQIGIDRRSGRCQPLRQQLIQQADVGTHRGCQIVILFDLEIRFPDEAIEFVKNVSATETPVTGFTITMRGRLEKIRSSTGVLCLQKIPAGECTENFH